MATGTFNDLQQRLNRKTVSKRMLADYPAFVRAYDLLQIDGEDLRGEPFAVRRDRLEAFGATLDPHRFDLSPMIAFSDWRELEQKRSNPPHPVIEGVMLKRRDSPYLAGRPKGPWFKWKRDPHTVDAVLMYAQRGHGKRSSFYSDYTFGVWAGPRDQAELVPVGKAYFGFTDEELRRIDKYVRDNTVDRFGPVRAVRAEPGPRPGAGSRLRRALPAPSATARASPCAFRASRGCDGTSPPPRPTASRPCSR